MIYGKPIWEYKTQFIEDPSGNRVYLSIETDNGQIIKYLKTLCRIGTQLNKLPIV